MARRLPWDAQPEVKRPSKIKREEKEPKPLPRDSSSSGDDLDHVKTHHGDEKGSPGRDGSNSPPPPAPPPEEYMVDGIENDDGWMMVEGELLTTARLFTTHLHHAEYQRVKGLARTRPADRLARPPRTSDASSVLRKLAECVATEAVDDMDNEELDPYNNDPLLAELMNASEEHGSIVGRPGKDANRQVAEESLTVPRARLRPSAMEISDLGSTAEPRSKVPNRGFGHRKVLGTPRDQQQSPAKGEIESPMRPRANALPAKLAAKLARRKHNEGKEDDGKKAGDVKAKDESGVADVPTFLL